MARTKTLNFVVAYGDTGYHVNDLGDGKSPRFELYYEPENKLILKTDNPYDCDIWINKNVWKDWRKEENDELENDDKLSSKRRRAKKS